MVLFIFLLLCHTTYTQKSLLKSPSANQIKGISVKTVTDTLGKSAEISKASKAGEVPPTQNM